MCRAWESVVHYAKSDKIVVLAVYGVMILFIVIGVIYGKFLFHTKFFETLCEIHFHAISS